MEYTRGKFKDGYTGWKAVPYKNKVGYATHEIHYSDDGECIAEVVHGEDDAKLIAAAPDLLEAALDFVNKVETGRAKSTDSYKKFKAAIEKATL